MIYFGDGREERIAAFDIELRLRNNPEVQRRNAIYEASLKAALEHAKTLSQDEIVDTLLAHNPAYIRNLLETEDDRFGAGALARRYAATFRKNFV